MNISADKNRLALSGFSLVELSIVLVILGLLVGGVMTGQNLIRAAELRSIHTEFNQWQTAVNLFKDKYMALPGDMPNATAFWSADSGCGTGGAGSNTEPGYLGGAGMVGTCNGDGSGIITNHNAASAHYESLLFWQHLRLASLISGNYTGVRSSGNTYHHVLGENAPRAKLGNAGWTAFSYAIGSTGSERFDVAYDNVFQFGGVGTDGYTKVPILTPEEAWNIDTKMDDGKPGQGSVISRYYLTCANAASDSDFVADYALSDSSQRCALYFRNGM